MNNFQKLDEEILWYLSTCYENDAKNNYHLYQFLRKYKNNSVTREFNNFLYIYLSIECILKSIYFLIIPFNENKGINLKNEIKKNKTHDLEKLIESIEKNKDLKLKEKFIESWLSNELIKFISKVNMNLRYEIDIIKNLRSLEQNNMLKLLDNKISSNIEDFYSYLCIIQHNLRIWKNYNFRENRSFREIIESERFRNF